MCIRDRCLEGVGAVNRVVATSGSGAASSSYATFFSASITPSSTAKKILVRIRGGNIEGGRHTSGSSGRPFKDNYGAKILRGATEVFHLNNVPIYGGGFQLSFDYVDSPASTSAQTYNFQWIFTPSAGSGNTIFNRTFNTYYAPLVMELLEID